MSEWVVPVEVLDHYERDYDESTRITMGFGTLELLRTREVVERVLPAGALHVLDVGGGTGVHARWLGEIGHTVTVVDASPSHVAASAALAAEGLNVTAELGDARSLMQGDATFDVVLMLGPLYHLTERADRVQAWREGARVVKPGGLVIAAVINRFASLFSGLTFNLLRDDRFRAIVERDLREGQHRNPGRVDNWFTTAYFHHPDELEPEALDGGVDVEAIIGIEGLAGWMPQLSEEWEVPAGREHILASARAVESEPSVRGLSPHLLVISASPSFVKIHLDTDLGSDTDDACALAMLLGWPEVEVVGITTTIDPGGIRAGFVTRVLELAGRTDILVAAGAEVSSTTGVTPGGIPTDARYWPDLAEPRPSPPGDATALLDASIEQGATIVAIGPYTNLAALGSRLGRAPVVLMGGMVVTVDAGLPDWGPDMDWNVQCDTSATQAVFEHAPNLTLTTLPPTFKSHLRVEHLPRFRAAGPIGALLAQQAESHSADNGIAELARLYPALPEDLLNFQYDAVACAVAAGWSGATIEPMQLSAVLEREVLRFEPDERGRTVRVVTNIDADDFTDHWIAAVERATRNSG